MGFRERNTDGNGRGNVANLTVETSIVAIKLDHVHRRLDRLAVAAETGWLKYLRFSQSDKKRLAFKRAHTGPEGWAGIPIQLIEKGSFKLIRFIFRASGIDRTFLVRVAKMVQ